MKLQCGYRWGPALALGIKPSLFHDLVFVLQSIIIYLILLREIKNDTKQVLI